MDPLERVSSRTFLDTIREPGSIVQDAVRVGAVSLLHVEHVLEVHVVAGQLIPQKVDDVFRELRLLAQDEAGQVARAPAFLGAVQQQRPGLVVWVQNVSVVYAFVW